MRDADALLALLMIGKQRNDFKTPTVTFTRSELVEILGWGDGGRSYERIEEALRKWMITTLFFKSSWGIAKIRNGEPSERGTRSRH
jgi:hypothetical protein